MAYSEPLKFFLHDGIDEVFDERGSSFCALRKVQWAKDGTEADPEKGKLEVRRWMVNSEGMETPYKGMTFLTEDGPHNLAHVLVSMGYGDTKEILNDLRKRDNFKEAVEHMNDDPDANSDSNGEYFDMRDLLLEDDSKDVEDAS